VEFYYSLLICLTALTVVALVSVVGIVLVIALITLPAATAGQFARTLWQLMAGASFFSLIFTTLGIAISFGPNLPTGATIIILACFGYLLALVIPLLWKRLR
jgi:zinc transport system permease protein